MRSSTGPTSCKCLQDDPAYALRRIWLTEEEEEGYYYGFANEGLWPLCHLAYVRPAFRESDWRSYEGVNRKFAAAIVSEARSDRPVVLVQDYHLALVPKLIRRRKPEATIVLFWHIPWPNAEAFGVCPWKCQILRHMLGADILGFHTRHHCQNFLATVDRYLECQIDHEQMTVTYPGARLSCDALSDFRRMAAAPARQPCPTSRRRGHRSERSTASRIG